MAAQTPRAMSVAAPQPARAPSRTSRASRASRARAPPAPSRAPSPPARRSTRAPPSRSRNSRARSPPPRAHAPSRSRRARSPPPRARATYLPPSRPRTRARSLPARAPYVPPFRQRRLDIAGRSTPARDMQRRAWTGLKKGINSAVNRTNASTVRQCAVKLLRLNLVRGRGLFCRSILRAQSASPVFSPVFAALVSVLNARMPELGALLVARLVAQLKGAYGAKDHPLCLASASFLACLFSQQVVNELVLLEFFATCLHKPTDGSVELVVSTLRDAAPFLSDRAPRALEVVFQRLREVLHDGNVGRRVQVKVEDLMAMRRKKFAGLDQLNPALDLVEDGEIITHFASLEEDDKTDLQFEWDSFVFDENYQENERLYGEIKRDILGAECNPRRAKRVAFAVPEKVKAGAKSGKRTAERPTDMTNSGLTDFRRTVYLTIGSGLSFEEWAHKLSKLMRSNVGREMELCKMIVECCSQEKTFSRSYALLGERFCVMKRVYLACFEELFAVQYATVHRLDTRKIRNTACFFAFLLSADALPWKILQVVRLVEEETTSSSRIYLKILFQEMSRNLGATNFQERFRSRDQARHLSGLFPTDSAQNARFSINFFTSIGLGFVTEDLREKLSTLPKEIVIADEDSDSSSSLSSSSLSSSSLSPSSGEGNGKGVHKSRARESAKRPNEVTSPDQLDLPPKARRRSFDVTGYDQRSEGRSRLSEEFRHAGPRREPNNDSEGRGSHRRDRDVRSIAQRGHPLEDKPLSQRQNGGSLTNDDASRSTTGKRKRRSSPSGREASESVGREGSRYSRRRRDRYDSDSSMDEYERSRGPRRRRTSDPDGWRDDYDDTSAPRRRTSRRHSSPHTRSRRRSSGTSRQSHYSGSSSSFYSGSSSYDSMLDDRRYARRRSRYESDSEDSGYRRGSRWRSQRYVRRSLSPYSVERPTFKSRSRTPSRHRHRSSRRRPTSVDSYSSLEEWQRRRPSLSYRPPTEGSRRRGSPLSGRRDSGSGYPRTGSERTSARSQ